MTIYSKHGPSSDKLKKKKSVYCLQSIIATLGKNNLGSIRYHTVIRQLSSIPSSATDCDGFKSLHVFTCELVIIHFSLQDITSIPGKGKKNKNLHKVAWLDTTEFHWKSCINMKHELDFVANQFKPLSYLTHTFTEMKIWS